MVSRLRRTEVLDDLLSTPYAETLDARQREPEWGIFVEQVGSPLWPRDVTIGASPMPAILRATILRFAFGPPVALALNSDKARGVGVARRASSSTIKSQNTVFERKRFRAVVTLPVVAAVVATPNRHTTRFGGSWDIRDRFY